LDDFARSGMWIWKFEFPFQGTFYNCWHSTRCHNDLRSNFEVISNFWRNFFVTFLLLFRYFLLLFRYFLLLFRYFFVTFLLLFCYFFITFSLLFAPFMFIWHILYGACAEINKCHSRILHLVSKRNVLVWLKCLTKALQVMKINF